MGEIRGFLKVRREVCKYRPVEKRIKDFSEVMILPALPHSISQACRCMDCGTPFCHWACPLGNYIPELNDLVYRGQWPKAWQLLQAANNFPEITARVCPALCEYSCVLGINDKPVTIRDNELGIIEQAFKKGWVDYNLFPKRSSKQVAVVGSGPAGLACADQLNKAGHRVTVFEKDDAIGGILRYGIPDFKLEKRVLDRRIGILEKQGVVFKPSTSAGLEYSTAELKKNFDAVCLACGSRAPRDLNIEGRSLKGIYFAMDYLIQSNKRVGGEKFSQEALIDARDKKVVVIGGGDTGADCMGVAHRQGAKSVVQIELLPVPPGLRTKDFPWPKFPALLKTTTSHEEGGRRLWSVLTKRFTGQDGFMKKLSCVKVDFSKNEQGSPVMREIAGSEFEIEADMAVLALGFLHPQKNGMIEQLGLALDPRGNVKADSNFMTSCEGVFCAGDMHRGQSLVVWAVSEGRRAAYCIDKYLMGQSSLPEF